ncbi:unnamed protein product, partial [Prorocentrum cordatum]
MEANARRHRASSRPFPQSAPSQAQEATCNSVWPEMRSGQPGGVWCMSACSTEEATALISNLYKCFIGCDCTMLEINPLATLKDGRVLVCDSKVNFDDNAEFRQKEIHAQRDTSQENAMEVEAKKYDLNYIKLDGSIACMVNGAGLAMSTMDLLSIL